MGAGARPLAQRPAGAASPCRRFVVISHQEDPMMAFAAAERHKNTPVIQSFATFIDTLADLCLCHHPMGIKRDKRVVYPIEAFDYPLNHAKLVEQRRRALKHKLFRPVSVDEGSVPDKYIVPKRQKANIARLSYTQGVRSGLKNFGPSSSY